MNEPIDVSHLKSLGAHELYDTNIPPSSSILEVFKNPGKGSPYVISFTCDEFTSLCPKTGQPDFGVIRISYIPKDHCIETKSLKMYLMAYRNYGTFMEAATNKMLNDFVQVCQPIQMQITAEFHTRGGIKTSVVAEYKEDKE